MIKNIFPEILEFNFALFMINYYKYHTDYNYHKYNYPGIYRQAT